MVQFKGFKTKEEAKAFKKTHGGLLTFDKRTKTGKPTGVGIDYAYAVNLGGLGAEKYLYCLQWANV